MLTLGGYPCPQCLSKYCQLPIDCRICGLTLVSSPHLARSFHHLFPVALFTEYDLRIKKTSTKCYGCQAKMSQTMCFVCERCMKAYCFDCDSYIHESLHNCPGCEMMKKKVIEKFAGSSE